MEMYIHGEYSFVKADVKQWADWGIDYLKYDWSPNDRYYTEEMYEALRACGRDIVYSISNNAPYADAPMWKELCQCWRTTGDIRDTWKSMSSIGFAHERWLAFTGPGHWADPDMLVVGMVGWGPKLHRTNLTADEQYTHISLWSLLAAPLLIGCPIDKLDVHAQPADQRRGDRRESGPARAPGRPDLAGWEQQGDLRQAPRGRVGRRGIVQPR